MIDIFNKIKIFIATIVDNQRKKSHKPAFTLAEILVCIGILGFIAAMTLPTLYNTYQKKLLKQNSKPFVQQ